MMTWITFIVIVIQIVLNSHFNFNRMYFLFLVLGCFLELVLLCIDLGEVVKNNANEFSAVQMKLFERLARASAAVLVDHCVLYSPYVLHGKRHTH